MGGLKPPQLECSVGMECYKSTVEGLSGVLKQEIGDFIVEEVTQEGVVLEVGKNVLSEERNQGRYVHCTLEKRNWDTMRAVKEVAKRLRVSQHRIGYGGTKDKRALTSQRISIEGVSIEDVKKVSIKDIVLRDFTYSDDSIGLGCLNGNRFTITIKNIELSEREIKDRVEKISEELKGGFPNYFGLQRFGIQRPITHLVGKEIIKGNFEEAVLIYLTKVYGEHESNEARKKLAREKDYKEALNYYPKNLGYENTLLNHLAVNPEDYKGALLKLPRGLSKMFVHAYQSYIFNKALSKYIENEWFVERLPLVGMNSIVDEVTQEIMDEQDVKTNDFDIRGVREFSSKGEIRDCYAIMEDFNLIKVGEGKAVVQFKLQSGCYATTLLREYLKNEY